MQNKALTGSMIAPLQPVATRQWNRTKQNAHANYLKKLRKIESATEEGRRPNRLAREFLHSTQNQMSAALKSLSDQPHPEEAIRIRNQMNFWSRETYRVNWQLEPKSNGGSRAICKLPTHLKAMHKMIGHILRAQMLPHDQLFGIARPKHSELSRESGYSRDDAIIRIQELKQAGFHCMAQVDIIDCFPSFNPDALYALPLPEEVIRQTLDTRNIHFPPKEQGQFSFLVPIMGNHIRNPHGPSGLMQGSPASSIIFAYFLNKVLYDLPECEDTEVIACFDNIVIASRTNVRLQAMINTLAGTLRQCCAGPFELHPPVYSNDDGFEFLGYLLSADGQTIGIAPDRLAKLEARLNNLESLNVENPSINTVKIWKAIASFANGYSEISDPREELRLYLETTETMLVDADLGDLVALQDMLFVSNGPLRDQLINRILSM